MGSRNPAGELRAVLVQGVQELAAENPIGATHAGCAQFAGF
jgi:hypothetical protein